MIKTPILALCAVASALLVVGQAYALALTNRDSAEHRIKITGSSGEPVTQDIVILSDETLNDLCMEGCSIALENGEQESFEGTEVVYIEGGRFVIAE